MFISKTQEEKERYIERN